MIRRLTNISRNPFLQGSVYLTISNFVVSFFNYLFTILVGRSLGPKGYGEIMVLFSYLILLSTPVTIISTALINKIVARGTDRFHYVSSLEKWLLIRIKRWWLLGLLLIISSPLLSKLTNLSFYSSSFLIPLAILGLIGDLYAAILQGLQLFLLFALINILTVSVKLMGAVFVFFGQGSVLTILIFLCLAGIIKFATEFFFLHKKDSFPNKQSPVEIKKRTLHLLVDRQLLLSVISVFFITLINNFDIILAKKILTDYEVGLYSSWTIFAKIIFFIMAPIISVTFVYFSGQNKQKNESLIFVIVTFLSALIGSLAFILYKFMPLLTINFIYGKKFISMSPYLPLGAVFGTLFTFIYFLNNYFLAKKSKVVLTFLIIIPLYIGSIVFYSKSITQLINFDVVFSLIVVLFLFIAFIFRAKRLYN